MVKKINKDAVLIKNLLERGFSQNDIAKLLNFHKTKVSYWAKTEIKDEQKRRKKLDKKYVDRIIDLAKNKTTSAMGTRKIAAIINAELEKEGVVDKNNKPIYIHHVTVSRYLRQYFGKPRKIRKTFFLNKE